MQMDFIPGSDFTDPRPVLPEGVAQCEGFGRPSWITKCVTLTNESGVDVARVICHCVNADLVIDSDGMPLGNDRVADQIAVFGGGRSPVGVDVLNESVAHP
jgi:hypothetical protein